MWGDQLDWHLVMLKIYLAPVSQTQLIMQAPSLWRDELAKNACNENESKATSHSQVFGFFGQHCASGLICLIKFDFQQLFVRCFEKHLLVNDLTSCQQYHFWHFQGPTWYHVSVKLTQDSRMIVAVTFFC